MGKGQSMTEWKELEKKVNPSGVDPRVLFMEIDNADQAKEMVESAVQAEMKEVKRTRSSLYNWSMLGIIGVLVLVFVRARIEQETVRLLLFGAAAVLIVTLLPMMTQIRRFKAVLEDEEDTLRQIREGKIDPSDFLLKFRAHKEEALAARGLQEEYAAYRACWEASADPSKAS